MNDGVREVHPHARFNLCYEFREDTFQNFIYNSWRFQILVLGPWALNASVKFLDIVRVTQHVGSRVDYTLNIFVHSLGVNPTDTIPVNVSTITQRAYDPICSFCGFILWSNNDVDVVDLIISKIFLG